MLFANILGNYGMLILLFNLNFSWVLLPSSMEWSMHMQAYWENETKARDLLSVANCWMDCFSELSY